MACSTWVISLVISCGIGKTPGKIKYTIILHHMPDNPQVAKKLRPPAEK